MTAKKPADQVQRRNKASTLDAQVVNLNTPSRAPRPPAGLSKEMAAEWRDLWKQPIASTFKPEHVPSLRRLFTLRHRVACFEEQVFSLTAAFDEEGEPLDVGPIVRGSTGQTSINPLLKQVDVYQAQILALEDRFGLNTMAAMKLGIAVGEAHKSLDEMNRRIVAGVNGGAATERPDPRITAINARTT